jgi:hypothetical protein
MPAEPAPVGLREQAVRLLEEHWDEAGGYATPNPSTYGPQWLWDSAFHSLAWAAVGRPDRAWVELRSSLACQHPDGFVPHMRYPRSFDGLDPVGLWGRSGSSIITQPPIYGHAVTALARAGHRPPPDLVEAASRGVLHLVRDRTRIEGLITVFHPWETGLDDSPRWDHWRGSSDLGEWMSCKEGMARSIVTTEESTPQASATFEVASIGFNALVAFAAQELAELTDNVELERAARDLVTALEARWNGQTWADAPEHSSSAVPTLDALLPLLVITERGQAEAGLEAISSASAHAARYGLRYVRADHPSYDPNGYWRGSSWMPLQYLSALAARRWGRTELFRTIRDQSIAAAPASGWAEHYHPDTAAGLGAFPQAWSTLVVPIAEL